MKKLTTRFGVSLVTALGTIALASAQTQQLGKSILDLLSLAQTIVNRAVPFLIGLAVVALFVGVVGFLFQKEAASHEKWGKFLGMAVLSLFVMVSIWGLVNFMGNIFGIGAGGNIPVPGIPVNPRVY